MRRLLVVLVLGVVTVVSIVLLAEATQNRPDTVAADSVGTVTFEVSTKRFSEATDPGTALWAACQASTGAATLDVGARDDNVYVATVNPALGKNAERRVRGCLHDGTLDRIRGKVLSIETLAVTRDDYGHDGTEVDDDDS